MNQSINKYQKDPVRESLPSMFCTDKKAEALSAYVAVIGRKLLILGVRIQAQV